MKQDFNAKGLLLALTAFSWWGLVTPFYFKWVSYAHPVEVLCHRVIWTLPICVWLLWRSHGWAEVRDTFKHGKAMLTLVLTAVLVAGNWGLYIYAVVSDRVLQGSLGYYINPLLNVVLGVLVLRESLSRLQLLAVLIAAAGTINMTIALGELPWIALTLGFTFALYGLLRKTMKIGAVGGLFLETLLLTPPSLVFLGWLWMNGRLALVNIGPGHAALLIFAGVVTALPLICFTQASRILTLSTLGICQYLAPSIMFFLAIFVYHEPFTITHLITFACIWTGCGMYVADSLRQRRRQSLIMRNRGAA